MSGPVDSAPIGITCAVQELFLKSLRRESAAGETLPCHSMTRFGECALTAVTQPDGKVFAFDSDQNRQICAVDDAEAAESIENATRRLLDSLREDN